MERLAKGFGLLEAARWYDPWGLVFSDFIRGGVHSLSPDGALAEVIAHRKGIGGLIAHSDGGFLVSGRNLAYKRPDQADAPTSVILECQPDEFLLNDLTADRAGRVYVGSLPRDGSGSTTASAGRLYRIGLDGSASVLAEDILISNGMAIAPEGMTLYQADTERRVVYAYALDPGDGAPTRSVHVDTSSHDGKPDGIAVDATGTVWVAMADGGAVIAWDRSGRCVAELAVPQSLVTTVCFGGPDGRSLFVLTGTRGEDDPHNPEGGCIYVERVDVPGAPTSRAHIVLGASAGTGV